MNALWSHRRDISLCTILRHAMTLKVLELSLNIKDYLSWNSPNMNPIEDVWNIMKKEIGNQKPCNKKICRSEYVRCGII